MARSRRQQIHVNQTAEQARTLKAHVTKASPEELALVLGRAASGAAGAHAKSSVRRTDAAGRRSRVGGRRQQVRTAVRDFS